MGSVTLFCPPPSASERASVVGHSDYDWRLFSYRSKQDETWSRNKNELRAMLPSPRWPNGSGRAPGMSFTTAALASRDERRHMRDRHRDVVLDRAADLALHLAEHFADAPEGLGLIERLSAIAASATSPRSTPSARMPSRVSRRPSRCCDDNSISTYHAMPVVQRIARAGVVFQHRVDAEPHHQLERRDVAAAAARSRCRAVRARPPGDATPTNAVSTERGRGIRRRVAAVMMPSVPSAPMNRFFRS